MRHQISIFTEYSSYSSQVYLVADKDAWYGNVSDQDLHDLAMKFGKSNAWPVLSKIKFSYQDYAETMNSLCVIPPHISKLLEDHFEKYYGGGGTTTVVVADEIMVIGQKYLPESVLVQINQLKEKFLAIYKNLWQDVETKRKELKELGAIK